MMVKSFLSKLLGSKRNEQQHKPLTEEDRQHVHDLAMRLAQATYADPYRGSKEQSDISSVVECYDALGKLVEPMRSHVVTQESLSPADRIKRIYPVIHRGYDLFVDTKQGDENVYESSIAGKSARLRIIDNQYCDRDKPDCGVIFYLNWEKNYFYAITCLRPTWKRTGTAYDKRFVELRPSGQSNPDRCVDMYSVYFKIDCMPPEKFVRALVAGGSEPELRQATLDHLLSLPEILGPYLDRKERGEL